MLNQAERRQLKAEVTKVVGEVFKFDGYTLAGETKQGMAFESETSDDWFVIQAIVKDPNKSDLADDLEDKELYEEAKKERELERQKKKEKREKKEKEKKEEKKENKEETENE